MKRTVNETSEKLVNRIIELSGKEKTIYNGLSILEAHNKKITDEYNKNMKYLNMVLELEEESYDNLRLNFSTCTDLYRYLLKEYKIELFEKNKKKDAYLNVIRAINILRNKASFFINENTRPSYYEQYFLMNTDVKNNPYFSMTGLNVRRLVLRDMYMGFIIYLQDHIINERNKSVRENLIQSKYDTSFIMPDIEAHMLLNNFNPQKELILSSEASAIELFNIKKNSYNLGRLKTINPIFESQTLKLIHMGDSLSENPKYTTQVLLRMSMLKAALSLYTREELNNLEADFKNSNGITDDLLVSTRVTNIQNAINEVRNSDNVVRLKIKV